MKELVFTAEHFGGLRSFLLSASTESAAVLFTSPSERRGVARLLVRSIEFPTSQDYAAQDELSAELSPSFVAKVVAKARSSHFGIVFAHSHPGNLPPVFSAADDEGEMHLAKFLRNRLPDALHAALVVSSGGLQARILGSVEHVEVTEVGATILKHSAPPHFADSVTEAHDRQVRAFGREGQQRLNGMRVAIVGLGGTGSLISQQLVHLGVKQFILVDPDTVETTNLNRLVNATKSHVDSPKTEVAQHYITSLALDAEVTSIDGDVMRSAIAQKLRSADFIFSCTDSHGSRSVIQQIAYQHLIPCIDMGTTIVATGEGRISHVQGRVQMLAPGLPCLHCTGLLNSGQIRQDMMTELEKKLDPYIVGAREPAPAVISINATVASLAVTMFLQATIGVPGAARYLLYNAIQGSVRPINASRDPECFICSSSGVLARGDSVPLMARQD